jgi:putative nucleotidyltransferase-like protein
VTVEAAFLLSSVRHFLNPAAPMPDPEKIDWPSLLDLAHAHAVIPMLYTALQNAPVPDSVSDELRSRFAQSVRWSLAQSAELVRLAALFEKLGIPMIALKGPMLSQYLYGDLASRMSGDIDVLVKAEDVLVMRDTLISNGYRATNSLPWNSRSACLRLRGREMAFDSPSGVSVDMHWRLLPPNFASVFDITDPWQFLRMESLAGQQIQTLAPETQLLFLCAHSSKHMFERLSWICDIARFVLVTPALDWHRLVSQSQQAHALRQLLLAVQLATDLFGVSVGAELPTDPVVQPLIRTVRKRLLASAKPPAPASESTRFLLKLLDRPGHRLRFLFGEYLKPSEAEYRVLKLPPWLHFLYYPFRPMRLLWKHAVLR